ncbi:peptidase M16C associated-domain-containing protein [Umbelopsis sp. PMI_123]|nr:peptidase M16C associated-domain-containing protein [Umbelopsis sp. PMI_123]
MLSLCNVAARRANCISHSRQSFRRSYAKAAILKPGDQLKGYRVMETRTVPELQLTAIQLQHEKTGAKHLHVERDDSNNVFAVGFSTPVSDSTGVPHILEHTTLCGSQKYPVRDPFFKMLNRSLATFMNAFTASDYTIYPFASTNEVDFNNLRSVYMDAAFFPHLRKLDFTQEGWRLEHENPKDKTSPIVFKGVVYNEMKGQMSDSSYLFYQRAQQNMYPGTTYENVSGGDPKHITDLTHEGLVQFQKTFYHPSNSHFYTYGKMPLETHLEAIDAQIRNFDPVKVPNVNKLVTPWNGPREIVLPCAADPFGNAEKQTKLSLSYLTNDSTDVFETFAMRLMSYLLLDGHASPMYKALIESGLGAEFSANTGYDSSTMQSCFSVGLQGIKSSDIDTIKNTIQVVFEKAHREGFDHNRVEAALHQMELSRKHKTADFGLSIMHGVSSGWFNGTNPADLLEVNTYIDRLRKELAEGGFFESRIEKYLLNNKHKLTFIMEPSTTFAAELSKEEQDRLKKKVSALTESDQKEIEERGLELLANQDKTEDLSCLPTLTLNDIPLKGKRTPLEHTAVGDTPVQWRTAATNGITYFRAISTSIGIPPELRVYLPLFCDALTSLGTTTKDMAIIDEEIRLFTGGLKASMLVSTNHSDLDHIEDGIALTGNCLDRNIDKMFDILETLVHETNFDDTQKLRTLIAMNAASMVNSVADSGHAYARRYASSTLTPAMAHSEIYGGMTQVDFMNKLANTEDLSDVISKLKLIASLVLKQSSLRVAVTCDDSVVGKNEQALTKFLSSLSKDSVSVPSELNVFVPQYGKTFFPLPFSVNFSAKVLRGVPYTHADGAKLQVVSSLMTSHFLHREIREKNGAYGGGAQYAGLNGLFSFYSYRDPKSLETIDTYSKAIDWIAKRKFSEQEMTEAKLSIFQGVDAPISVSQEGLLQFTDGISDDIRQRRREQLLNVTEEDVKHAAHQYLAVPSESQQYSLAILGEQTDKINSENGWNIRSWGDSPTTSNTTAEEVFK